MRTLRAPCALLLAVAAEAFLAAPRTHVLRRALAGSSSSACTRRAAPAAAVRRLRAQAEDSSSRGGGGKGGDSDDTGALYAGLRQRRSELAARGAATQRERALVAALAETYFAPTEKGDAYFAPVYRNHKQREERAVRDLWEHWFGEEGDAARQQLEAAEGDASALLALMDEFPDWVRAHM